MFRYLKDEIINHLLISYHTETLPENKIEEIEVNKKKKMNV
jgi:hypothetical protein